MKPTVAAKNYVQQLIDHSIKLDYNEFVRTIYAECYSKDNTEFIEFCLESHGHQDEFIVHHSEIRKYGVMTSTNSKQVKRKLNNLKMEEGTDYMVVEEPSRRGVKTKNYILTPKTFKKCIMETQRFGGQPNAPKEYIDTYIDLEEIATFFGEYIVSYFNKIQDTKIGAADTNNLCGLGTCIIN